MKFAKIFNTKLEGENIQALVFTEKDTVTFKFGYDDGKVLSKTVEAVDCKIARKFFDGITERRTLIELVKLLGYDNSWEDV